MSVTQLIDIILINPTVTLTPSGRDTGFTASYTFQPLSNLVYTRDQQVRGRLCCAVFVVRVCCGSVCCKGCVVGVCASWRGVCVCVWECEGCVREWRGCVLRVHVSPGTNPSLAPLPPLHNPPPHQITTCRGIVMGRLRSDQRQREVELMRFCFRKLGLPIVGEVRVCGGGGPGGLTSLRFESSSSRADTSRRLLCSRSIETQLPTRTP